MTEWLKTIMANTIFDIKNVDSLADAAILLVSVGVVSFTIVVASTFIILILLELVDMVI